MKPLSTAQQTATDGPVTEPQYLIQIDLDQTYYLSTREDVTYSGNAFVNTDIIVDRVAPDRCELQITNHDWRHTMNAQAGVYLRNSVKVWWYYGPKLSPVPYVESGYWESGYTAYPDDTQPGAILLFDGVIHGTPSINEWLTVTCRREPPRLYPFTKLRPPIANFTPSSGYVIQFDGAVLKIEGR